MHKGKKNSHFVGRLAEKHAIVLTTVITVIFIVLLFFLNVDYKSSNTMDNFVNALDTTVVFVSIVIGFVGVLLASLLEVKDKSNIIKRFFRLIDENTFSKAVKSEIISGIACSLISILSYMLIYTEAICFVFLIWIWIVIYFSISTYNLISNLLKLLLSNTNVGIDEKIEGKLDEKSSQELRNKFSK